MTPLSILCKRCYRPQFWSMLRPRVIVGVVFGRLSRLIGRRRAGENAQAELTPTSPGARFYVVSVSERRIGTYSTIKADRTASAKDAANDIQHFLACDSSNYARCLDSAKIPYKRICGAVWHASRRECSRRSLLLPCAGTAD